MSPRIAMAAGPAVAGSANRATELRAKIAGVMTRSKEMDRQSIDLARRFATAQQDRDRAIAEGDSAAEIERARELVERLRREQQELVGVRAHLAAKAKQVRAELIPAEAEETLAQVVTLAARLDSVMRPAGREARSILPVLMKAASAAQVAERSLSAANDQRKESLTGIADALPHIDELVRVTEALIAYATTTRAPEIERNRPAGAANAAAPSPTSPGAAA